MSKELKISNTTEYLDDFELDNYHPHANPIPRTEREEVEDDLRRFRRISIWHNKMRVSKSGIHDYYTTRACVLESEIAQHWRDACDYARLELLAQRRLDALTKEGK